MVKVFQKEHITDVLRAVLYALIVSVVCVLLYAVLVKFLVLSDTAILIGNTIIKLVSVLLGTFFAFRNFEQGIIKGLLVGFLYVIISHFIFSLLSGSGLFTGLDFVSVGFSLLVGVISGIIVVNVRK